MSKTTTGYSLESAQTEYRWNYNGVIYLYYFTTVGHISQITNNNINLCTCIHEGTIST